MVHDDDVFFCVFVAMKYALPVRERSRDRSFVGEPNVPTHPIQLSSSPLILGPWSRPYRSLFVFCPGCPGSILVHGTRWPGDSSTVHRRREWFPAAGRSSANAAADSASDSARSRVSGQSAGDRVTVSTIIYYTNTCGVSKCLCCIGIGIPCLALS